jgi:hypothetical protein
MRKFIKKIKRKLFCSKQKHKWMYYTAGNRVVEVKEGFGFADIPMRQCDNCKELEEKWFDGKWRKSE